MLRIFYPHMRCIVLLINFVENQKNHSKKSCIFHLGGVQRFQLGEEEICSLVSINAFERGESPNRFRVMMRRRKSERKMVTWLSVGQGRRRRRERNPTERRNTCLQDGYSQIFRSCAFGPPGFWTMAPLCYAAIIPTAWEIFLPW